MDEEDGSFGDFLSCEGRDTRNLKHNGVDGKRWNKKEAARRLEIMEKRKNQGIVEEEPELEGKEVVVKEKKYDNGKPKKVTREPSPIHL